MTPSTLYVLAAGLATAFYTSTDGGETWSVINPGPVWRFLTIVPTTPSTLYAIVGAGLSNSTDGGANWTATGFYQGCRSFGD